MNAQHCTISGKTAISGWNWLLHQPAGSCNYDKSPSDHCLFSVPRRTFWHMHIITWVKV